MGKGDLAGMEAGAKTEFDGNIDKCASWNGDFGSRRKREVEETETEEEASNVPSVMESGSSALGWLKAAVRKTRNSEPGKGKQRNVDKKGKKRNANKKGKGRKAKKKGQKRNSNKKGKGRKAKKKGKKRNSNKKGKGRKAKK